LTDQTVQEKDTSVDEDVRAALESLRSPATSDTPSQPDLLDSAPKEGETQEQAGQARYRGPAN
jgi:hypothetical protein